MKYDEIWERALPYQDKRDDEGHAQLTLGFAKKLLETEKGDPDIVIPAIILHDIGWSQLPADRRFAIFSGIPEVEKLKYRVEHQEEGAKLARRILDDIGYPEDKIEGIVEIVSEHDTREGFLDINDGIVRDADKLWRFSKTGINKDMERFGMSRDELISKRLRQIEEDGFFCTDSAKRIAKESIQEAD